MTEQHECEITEYPKYAGYVVGCEVCGTILTKKEMFRRLNEYETLKKATEALSAEDAASAYHFITAEGNMADRARAALRAYADILEGK